MGRHQEFDAQDVLERAMWIFWDKGYRATSLVDLEAATGLQTGSIYNAFGSKKGLFLAVIDYYIERVVGLRVETVLQAGKPLEAIEAFFRTAYVELPKDQLMGCMLTNSATEIGSVDAQVQERVAAGIARIESAFRDRLLEAQAAGDLGTDKDPAILAVHLASCYQGLGVTGRLTRDKTRLEIISDAAMSCLR
ncbi:TetR/AcrR family transcriptional regulator [Pelagibius sp. Alg239-R121]|uniref:TetR/AcrR family transcriptional regulator n=1 Tax=Pelagibius sp. Alg239-R121 TaxID=2993448 RepID=UPI0024A7813C|nr:TetR/AcrR family transcriptional regulator [Pelagibius sp. Alg239-R121]